MSGQLHERPTDLLSDPNTRRKQCRGYRHETGEGAATDAFMYPASLALADSDLVYMISRTTGAWLAPLHYYPVPSFLSSLIHQSKPASLQMPLVFAHISFFFLIKRLTPYPFYWLYYYYYYFGGWGLVGRGVFWKIKRSWNSNGKALTLS